MQSDQTVGFETLSQSREFLEFGQSIRQLTRVPIGIYDATLTREKSIAEGLSNSPLCDLIWSVPGLHEACIACNRKFCRLAVECGHGIRYRCHRGLIDMAVPVFAQGRHVANIFSGQLLPSPPSADGLRAFLRQNRDLGLDPDDVREAYFRAPYLPMAAVDSLLDLISFFAAHVCGDGSPEDAAHIGGADPILQARRYVDTHFREPISLADAAAHAALSPWQLSRGFHKSVGMPFIKYLNRRRTQQAKKLLSGEKESVSAAAYDAGFTSISQFNRTFRAVEGCTPQQYRSRMRSLR